MKTQKTWRDMSFTKNYLQGTQIGLANPTMMSRIYV